MDGRSRRSRLVTALVALAVLAVTVHACTDEPGEPDDPKPGVALELTLATGTDEMQPGERDELLGQVGDALTAYVVGAFLGDYPRDDFVEALDAFTAGAVPAAAQSLDFLTAAGLDDPSSVVATKLDASISVFAPDGVASGASARVHFEFDVTDANGPDVLTRVGRLSLTPVEGTWKIFAFDVKSAGSP